MVEVSTLVHLPIIYIHLYIYVDRYVLKFCRFNINSIVSISCRSIHKKNQNLWDRYDLHNPTKRGRSQPGNRFEFSINSTK